MVYPLRCVPACGATTTKQTPCALVNRRFADCALCVNCGRIMRAWFSCRELLSCALCVGKVVQVVRICNFFFGDVRCWHRYRLPTSGNRHETHPNSGGVAVQSAGCHLSTQRHEAITATMRCGVLAFPSGSGHDTVNPWDGMRVVTR